MNENNIQLGEKIVGDIQGEFYIPSYQCGYRWDESQGGHPFNGQLLVLPIRVC